VADASGEPAGVGVVAVVAGGPASRAGIRAGDVITHVAGEPTPTAQALAVVLAQQQVGSSVPVQLSRGGSTTSTVTVTLGSL
jgi:putative serine protease PepD